MKNVKGPKVSKSPPSHSSFLMFYGEGVMD